MSELCTLAASVVLQSQPEANSTEPISSDAPPTLHELENGLEPSVGCDGSRAIAPTIAPESLNSKTSGAIVEFSARGKHRPGTLPEAASGEKNIVLSQLVQEENQYIDQIMSRGFGPHDFSPRGFGLQVEFSTHGKQQIGTLPEETSLSRLVQEENRYIGQIGSMKVVQKRPTLPRVAVNQVAAEEIIAGGEVTTEEIVSKNTASDVIVGWPIASEIVAGEIETDDTAEIRSAIAPPQHLLNGQNSNGQNSNEQPEDTKRAKTPELPVTMGVRRSNYGPIQPNASSSSSSTPNSGWPSLLNPVPYPPLSPGMSHPPSTATLPLPSFQPIAVRPLSGGQLFQQRLAALRAGRTYTRLPSNSFETYWRHTSYHPTYQDWLNLLSHEARSMSGGQGRNPLTIIVGDSLSLWMPTEFLPNHRFWLNQSISGETAAGMVRRLYMFDQTRPDVIHVMAGINDLKNGATDTEVLTSLQTMMRQLQHRHPQARVVVHSILPTRLSHLPSDRIRRINHQLAQVAHKEGTYFLDLQAHFTDRSGHLRQDLTTDGLHLNYRGYTMWQAAMHQAV